MKKRIIAYICLLIFPLLTACPPVQSIKTDSVKTQKEVRDELIVEIQNQINWF